MALVNLMNVDEFMVNFFFIITNDQVLELYELVEYLLVLQLYQVMEFVVMVMVKRQQFLHFTNS